MTVANSLHGMPRLVCNHLPFAAWAVVKPEKEQIQPQTETFHFQSKSCAFWTVLVAHKGQLLLW